MDNFIQKYVKAKEYFLHRVNECDDVETAFDDVQCAINDAANIYADSREEYQKIYDWLNNLAYFIVL